MTCFLNDSPDERERCSNRRSTSNQWQTFGAYKQVSAELSASSPYHPAIREVFVAKMMKSAFCLLLGLQLSNCMSINQTSVDSSASNNSSICTEEWDSASPVNLCKIYNWFGGLTNLFRKTGEVVSEIEDTFFVDPQIVSNHHGYGDEVKSP